ncbi:heparinase II/III domain-containing protein [Gulosibacter chungangensis]|uniref:Heparinase II/III-like C-terminal domain-containing protein n=1 Tax=Gulosibacter chungangensis TaxID=979746 RepID=A0A7J5B7J4_9MICO|nr:heparinase II/III family protein [Gulosibacter chungangensis]KAB1640835.1 hypothetical protein F8O05_14140 [Gulosibacter chungangensis]
MSRSETRKNLRRGHITVPEKYQVAPIAWRDGLDYEELNKGSESFKWWLSCLGFLRVFANADQLSEDDEEVCLAIISDWFAHNPQTSPAISRAWDAHAVAYRTDSLIDIAERVSNSTWLDELLEEHKAFLALEDNFQGNWNHGVDQAKSLINVAERLKDASAQQIGLTRLEGAMLSIVDDEGVTIEQAVHYDYFNYQQLDKCISYLDGHPGAENTIARLRERMQKMPDFLAHATRPDGTWFEIGDTPIEPAGSIPGTIAEYAATQGANGPRPDETVRTFSAGYIFGRSGWGESREFAEESAYSIRFGPGRLIHGHADNLSLRFVSRGIEIIKDGGFHGYTDDENRAFLRSQAAHSTIIASRGRKKSTTKPSELTFSRIEPQWQSFTINANPFEHTYVTRSIYIEFDPDIVVVWDRLRSRSRTPFEQRWIINPEFRLTQRRDAVTGIGPTPFVATQHLRVPFRGQSSGVINANETDAPLGATETLIELTRNGLIQHKQTGLTGEFLTVFEFGTEEPNVRFTSRRTGLAAASRHLVGVRQASFLDLDGNTGLVPRSAK